MNLLDLVAELRDRLSDVGGDRAQYVPWETDDTGCLWHNLELVKALNWAHREIALRQPYRDSTTAAISAIRVAATTAAYTLDPQILSIEDVVLASTKQSLQKTTVRDLRLWATGTQNTTGIDAWKTTVGTPLYYCEDATPGKITLIPVPVINDSLVMTVYRLPLEPFSWESRSGDLDEPPEQLTEALLQGALSRALQKRNSDTFDAQQAAAAVAQFNHMVGQPVDYKTLEARRWNANLDVSIRPAAYTKSRARSREWE